MIRYCEFCKKEIDEKNLYGKGRFCNRTCQVQAVSKKGSEKFKENCEKRKQENTITKVCPCCGKSFTVVTGNKYEKKFCSRHCSATFSGNKSREKNEDTKQKISKSIKETLEKKTIEQKKESIKKALTTKNLLKEDSIHFDKPPRFCGICNASIDWNNKTNLCQHCLRTTEYGKKILADNARNAQRKLVEQGNHKGWMSRNTSSYAEIFWKKVLDNNNIPYEREKTQKYGNGADEKYFLDFYIESKNRKIDLEIDGKQHKYEDRIEHDKVRDKRLQDLGFIVYRIEWNEINTKNGKALMKSKIDKFLDFIK